MKTGTDQKILSYIRLHKKTRPHDLVSFLHMSQMAIHKQLKKLITKGLITKSGSSPLTYYSLPGKKEDIKIAIKEVLRKHGVKKASIFGSYARGQATGKSDIDILVDYPKNKSLYDFVELKLDLEDTLNKKVDLVEFGRIKPYLRERILAEQMSIL